MSKESKTGKDAALLAKLQQAQSLLDECIAEIQGQPPRRSRGTTAHAPSHKSTPAPRDLDFEANERAFVKAHARGLSGPKKFVLLVAHLAKGKAGTEVSVKEVEKRWNKMTASNLLDGKFNTFYSTTAKENGWVNTRKQGVYVLQHSWQEIFK